MDGYFEVIGPRLVKKGATDLHVSTWQIYILNLFTRRHWRIAAHGWALWLVRVSWLGADWFAPASWYGPSPSWRRPSLGQRTLFKMMLNPGEEKVRSDIGFIWTIIFAYLNLVLPFPQAILSRC